MTTQFHSYMILAVVSVLGAMLAVTFAGVAVDYAVDAINADLARYTQR